jgi:hypothetical protein
MSMREKTNAPTTSPFAPRKARTRAVGDRFVIAAQSTWLGGRSSALDALSGTEKVEGWL